MAKFRTARSALPATIAVRARTWQTALHRQRSSEPAGGRRLAHSAAQAALKRASRGQAIGTQRCTGSAQASQPGAGDWGSHVLAAKQERPAGSARCGMHTHAFIPEAQFTNGLLESMTGIVAARCDPAAAQWAVMRIGMPVERTE
eukprot:366321-Chlamydomonas_euryale.AAC.5